MEAPGVHKDRNSWDRKAERVLSMIKYTRNNKLKILAVLGVIVTVGLKYKTSSSESLTEDIDANTDTDTTVQA